MPNYRVSGVACNWCVSLDIGLILLHLMFQMELMRLVLPLAVILLTTIHDCESANFRHRVEAKIHCLEIYANCFDKNRCDETKFRYRKKYCDRVYTECSQFAKRMFRSMDATKLTRGRGGGFKLLPLKD